MASLDQANALRASYAARTVIKRSRWLLLRNRQNLAPEQAIELDELLAANAPLTTVYLFKAQPQRPLVRTCRGRGQAC